MKTLTLRVTDLKTGHSEVVQATLSTSGGWYDYTHIENEDGTPVRAYISATTSGILLHGELGQAFDYEGDPKRPDFKGRARVAYWVLDGDEPAAATAAA